MRKESKKCQIEVEQTSKKKGVNQLKVLINPLYLLVHLEGFGPPTPGFEVQFNQLSKLFIMLMLI